MKAAKRFRLVIVGLFAISILASEQFANVNGEVNRSAVEPSRVSGGCISDGITGAAIGSTTSSTTSVLEHSLTHLLNMQPFSMTTNGCWRYDWQLLTST